jgi:AcrR family transcriptional regulator
MTGLRDRKKKEVRHRIVQAARDLYASKGIDDTTMEEVARAADISVATVYNYFGNKNSLLLAGVEEDTDEMIELGNAVLARPGSNPVRAVQRLLKAYSDHFAAWDPRLLREVLSAAFQRAGGEELTVELAAMDQRLIEQMMTLLAGFEAKQKLNDAVDVYEATLLLFSTFVTQLFMFISIEGFTTEDLHDHVARQVELAFGGLAPQTNKKAKRT